MASTIDAGIKKELKTILLGPNPDAAVSALETRFSDHAAEIERIRGQYRSHCSGSSEDKRRCLENIISGGVDSLDPFGNRIPRYTDDIAPFLRKGRLSFQSDANISGSGAVRVFNVVKKNTGSVVARMFTVEPPVEGKLDVLTPNGDRPESFSARAQAYEVSHPGRMVVLQVAGAFSCLDALCSSTDPKHWEPDGFHLNDGQSVGWRTPNKKYGGVVVITAQGPAIYNRNKIPKDSPLSEDFLTIEELAAHRPDWLHKADLFQARTLVENGMLAVAPPYGEKGSSPEKATRRLLIEREFYDAHDHLVHTWAIVQIDEEMNLYDTARFGAFIGAKNVALLNTGGHALGWMKDAQGMERPLLTPHNDRYPMPNFTSVLLMVVPQR